MRFSYKERVRIQEYLDRLLHQQEQRAGQSENQSNPHALTNYNLLFRQCEGVRLPFGSYPTFHDLSELYGDTVHTAIVERRVEFRLVYILNFAFLAP